MKPIRSQEQIEEMRKRLYDRGTQLEQSERHTLSDEQIDVARDWSNPQAKRVANVTDLRNAMPMGETAPPPPVSALAPKRHYRGFLLSGSLLIFVFVAAITSLWLYFGFNQVSSDNIAVSIQGQSLIGGGETMPLTISVTNDNTVPMEAATLILRYPAGTRSVGDSPRNLFEERISLETVAPEEVRTVPVRVAVFGEENAEKKIEATIEYRVEGSNGIFYKDATPFLFRISSAPLVLRVENLEKVASGQETDVKITVVSNASTPLHDIVITASYPNGFDFEKSEPAPVYGENVWRIAELLPEQSTVITIQGLVLGLTDETFRINFAAGPADSNNQYLIGSKLADSRADFTIERPFIDVKIAINGDADRSVILPQDQTGKVQVTINNTLDEAVYDMVVDIVPSGNALKEDSIVGGNGFYDSNRNAVRWEVANNPSFSRVLPGDTRNLEFEVKQGPTKSSSAFAMVVNVYARRVAESSAVETLIGTVKAEAKYSSNVTAGSQIGRNTANFADRGPIPPKVGEETTYTATIVAEAGVNDVTNAVVETSLPLYVDWLDLYEGEGKVIYNPISKKMQWEIGDIPAFGRKELSFQLAIRPSISQLSTTPVILNNQSYRANDRFTGVLLQATVNPLTTQLSEEMGYGPESGKVTR